MKRVVLSSGVAFCKTLRRQSRSVFVGVAACLVFIASSVSLAWASDVTPEEIDLWENGAPGQLPDAGRGVERTGSTVPALRDVGYRPLFCIVPLSSQKKSKAVILCPGGGYRVLAAVPTGNGVLEPFLKDGYAVLVLKYRILPNAKEAEAAALEDAQACGSARAEARRTVGDRSTRDRNGGMVRGSEPDAESGQPRRQRRPAGDRSDRTAELPPGFCGNVVSMAGRQTARSVPSYRSVTTGFHCIGKGRQGRSDPVRDWHCGGI